MYFFHMKFSPILYRNCGNFSGEQEKNKSDRFVKVYFIDSGSYVYIIQYEGIHIQ